MQCFNSSCSWEKLWCLLNNKHFKSWFIVVKTHQGLTIKLFSFKCCCFTNKKIKAFFFKKKILSVGWNFQSELYIHFPHPSFCCWAIKSLSSSCTIHFHYLFFLSVVEMKSFVPEIKGNLIKILPFSFVFCQVRKIYRKRLSENIFLSSNLFVH